MGPQCRARGQPDRREQMDIDVADPAPRQTVVADEVQNLDIGSDAGLRQIQHSIQDDVALTEIAERELAKNKGVRQHLSGLEELNKRLAPGAEMVYPNRGVDQNHAGLGRRRGGAFNPRSLPPSLANRRALSRSIRALSASLTRPDFSVKPVSA
jgi:hypothetical protein